MNRSITFEQEQALSSLNRVWVLIEMMSNTFTEDAVAGSKEKMLTAWYMLEDAAAKSAASVKEAFS